MSHIVVYANYRFQTLMKSLGPERKLRKPDSMPPQEEQVFEVSDEQAPPLQPTRPTMQLHASLDYHHC